eukprot:CFRG6566T1
MYSVRRFELGAPFESTAMSESRVASVAAVLSFWYDEGIETSFKRKWFVTDGRQQEVDEYIQTHFKATVEAAEKNRLTEDEWFPLSPKNILARILILDQFSRHLYRGRDDRDERVFANDRLALALTESILEKKWDNMHTYTPEQLVFVYMPLRHSASVERLEMLMKKIDERLDVERQRNELLLKFRKQSLRRLHDLQNKAGDVDDILEFHPFTADESKLLNTPLTKTIHGFLADHGASQLDYVMISLSGGVDSMVLAYICLRLGPLLNGLKVICAHIDYNNRPESTAEANYLKQWCDNLGIEIVVYTIGEIKRGVTPRDEYEKKSREVRYDLYKQIMKDLKQADGSAASVTGVLVGHHQGDVQENVISNMMKGCSLLEVAGMTDTSMVNGVSVWRPMLPHEKKDVFAFAHTYGIPYFKDTTPRWSTRGKLRNQLLPTLSDVYGDGFTRNLSLMASDSAQLQEMCHKSVFLPMWNTMIQTPNGVYFDCLEWLKMPIFFWKQTFRHVCHDLLASPKQIVKLVPTPNRTIAISEQPLELSQLAPLMRQASAPLFRDKTSFPGKRNSFASPMSNLCSRQKDLLPESSDGTVLLRRAFTDQSSCIEAVMDVQQEFFSVRSPISTNNSNVVVEIDPVGVESRVRSNSLTGTGRVRSLSDQPVPIHSTGRPRTLTPPSEDPENYINSTIDVVRQTGRSGLSKTLAVVAQNTKQQLTKKAPKRRTKDLFFGLKKGLNLFLCDSTLFIFAPEAFPATPPFTPKSTVHVGQKYRFGLWEVQLVDLDPKDDRRDKHAFTVQELWSGNLQYVLRGGYDFMLVEGGKGGRPKSFRQIDVRVTNVVPLVNFDESRPNETQGKVMVKLNLVGKL